MSRHLASLPFALTTLLLWRQLLLCALLSIGSAAHAQPYPDKPVTIIVPYAAGGLTDQLARELGAHLAKTMGKPTVVDNKPGGGGQIATSVVKQAPADGYTLFIADFGPLALNWATNP